MFIPHQVKQPIIGANTYRQVQQKLSSSAPPPPPPVILPPYVPPQMQPQLNYGMQPEKSTYNSQPTPVVLSSAPKLYTNRTPSTLPTPAIDVVTVSYDVSAKLKKLKSSSNNNSSLGSSSAAAAMAGPNPIAEEAIKAARASSALQSFTHEKRSEKGNKGGGGGGAGSGGGGGGANSKKTVRTAGGQVWEDASLADWSDDDYRIFAGDLGNDVNDELLIRTFNKFPSFQRAKVLRDKRTGKSRGFGFISFKEPQDFIKAMKEMDGECGDAFHLFPFKHIKNGFAIECRQECPVEESNLNPWVPSRTKRTIGERSSCVVGGDLLLLDFVVARTWMVLVSAATVVQVRCALGRPCP